MTNSDLVGTLTTLAGQTSTYTYEPNRNLRTQINNQFSATLVSQYDYLYDALGRRTSVKNSGTAFAAAAFNRFIYNDRSELNESARYLGTDINILTSPVTGEYRSFVYDPIGNRTNITVATNNGTYSANNLNQYSTENVAGGGTNTFTYDDDGNLTAISGNKNVQYVFNAENQVVTMQPTTPALNDKKVDSVYDYQGRRVQKIVSNWSGVTWVPLTTKRFVYDGWNMIEEQTVAGTSKYQIWGLDLSQSMQGAGGIGGLLTQVDVGAVKSYAYLYDGNGNVGQLIDNSDGSIDAHYEYDPYGGSILASGTAASGNPYRFSTKYLDSEYGLYYYGYRYYDPLTGRWLSRDPIDEPSFLFILGFEDPRILDIENRYRFSSNDSITSIDLFGLVGVKEVQKKGGVIIVEKVLEGVGVSVKFASPIVKFASTAVTVAKFGYDAYKLKKELEQDDEDNEKLFAFGNSKSKPTRPRWKQDFNLESENDLIYPSSAKGKSVWGDVVYAPLTGPYFSIPKYTPMPDGLAVVADGEDVGGPHRKTHHTIFATICMPYKEFVEKFYLLPWKYEDTKK